MSAYRRFISYMYDHLQNSKGKNCGFVKIEIKNSRCTISFQLRHAPCQETCNVYLYCPAESEPFLYAGSIPIQKGNTGQKLTLDSMHMADSDISFSKCAGLLCTDEKGNNCCTSWTDNITIPAYRPQNSSDTSSKKGAPETTSEAVFETTPEIIVAETPEIIPQTMPEETSEIISETISETMSERADSNTQSKSFPEIWAHLQAELPALDPFEDNAIVETIRITPSDLGYLQCCKIELEANQFLLHGYKNYHHLILGRIHGETQYIIGIPGVYDPQEQFMAKMFGFPCFKPIRECRRKNGQFGYWLRCFR